MKNFRFFKTLWLSLLLVCLISGCRKQEEENPVPPAIQLLVPSPGDLFQVTDTIFVQVRISHANPVTQASITIINAFNNPVTNTISREPNVNDYHLEGYLIFNNIKLPSADYEIMVRASDGTTASSHYTDIYVEGIPLRLRQLWIVSRQNELKTYLSRYDSVYAPLGTVTFNAGYQNSAMNSMNNQFYFANQPPSRLIAYDSDSLDFQWEFQPVSPYSEIYGLFPFDHFIYAATGNGDLFGLNEDGLVKINTPVNPDRIPEVIFRGSKYLVSYQLSRSGSGNYIAAYYALTGAKAGEVRTVMEAKAFAEKSAEELYVFGNIQDTGRIMVLDMPANQIYEEAVLKSSSINAVSYIGDNRYAIAAKNAIYEYNAKTFNFYMAIPAPGIKFLVYDPLSGILFAAGEQNVRVYDYESGGMITAIQVVYSVAGLHIRYNR